MSSRDYAVIEDALDYLTRHRREQPSLDALSARAGLSPAHLQRVFRRWAGVSPKRFLQFLTLEHAKACLRESASVLDASYEAGLSGPGRLHDLFCALEGVTPGEFKRSGAALEIRWGVHESPFGSAMLGLTPRGICWLAFLGERDQDAALAELSRQWRGATLVHDPASTQAAATRALTDSLSWDPGQERLRLFVRGTNLQLQVWRALLRVPPGSLVSYGQLAAAVGRPDAARAVASAVGANPISYLIPCHRVIRKSGHFEAYRWGRTRKQALLGWEAARAPQP